MAIVCFAFILCADLWIYLTNINTVFRIVGECDYTPFSGTSMCLIYITFVLDVKRVYMFPLYP